MTKQKRQDELRRILIANGIRNLKEIGYPAVTEADILTDEIYREFFRPQLESWKYHSAGDVRESATALLAEIGGKK